MKTAMLNLLGVLFYKTNETKDAVNTFEDILSLDPQNLNGLENLAIILDKEGRSERNASEQRKKIHEVL